jgi:hypothetical protein
MLPSDGNIGEGEARVLVLYATMELAGHRHRAAPLLDEKSCDCP